MVDKSKENLEYFNCLGSQTTNDAKCVREIKSRIGVATAAFSEKKVLVAGGLYLNLGKKLVESG
jgi:hypothetical protein